ncbi:MAG: Ig-like domain-containing protein, partial [Ramlibacter sp.]
ATWSTATATAGATGWSHAATLTGSGTLVVRVVDGFGRAGVAWSQDYVLDIAAPGTPRGMVLSAASDTGRSATDRITSDRTPTVTGTAQAGATVNLYDTGGTKVLGTAIADGGGHWSITSTALANGSHGLTARATDLAGNTSAASTALGITVDSTAAVVRSVTSPQTAGVYQAGDVIALKVQFSERVTVAGDPRLMLETGTADRSAVYAGGSGTDTLTFRYTVQPGDRSADLEYLGREALHLDGGMIRDLAGNHAKLALPALGATGSLAVGENLRIDGIAPTLVAARVDGAKLVLQYNEALDGSRLPAGSAFTVLVDGAQVGVDGVRYNATRTSIVLELDSAATQGEAVRVTYRDAAGDQLQAIQDVAGNDAASLTGVAARNFTANDPGKGGAIIAPADEPTAGQLLRADTGSLRDADGVRSGTLAYQWLRNGVAIEGADQASYRLGQDDIGARISLEMNYRDGAGNRETVVTDATARVADNDGVASSVEALAPALGNGIQGDGNGDGLRDKFQSEVATAVVPGTSGAARFVTLVADDGRITGLSTEALSGVAPANARFGERSLVMEAKVDGRGADAEFSLFVARTLDAEGLWLQDRNGQWHNATADLANGGGKTRLDFVVRDGGAYDHDGLADGRVQLVGVVGDAPTSIGGVVPGWDGGFWF